MKEKIEQGQHQKREDENGKTEGKVDFVHRGQLLVGFDIPAERFERHGVNLGQAEPGKKGHGHSGLVVNIGAFPFVGFDGIPKSRRSVIGPIRLIDG